MSTSHDSGKVVKALRSHDLIIGYIAFVVTLILAIQVLGVKL